MVQWLGPLSALMSSVTWAVGSTFFARMARDSSAFAVNFTRAIFGVPLFVMGAFVVFGFQGGLLAFARVEWSHFAWLALSTVCSYGLADAMFYWSARSLGVPGALAIASAHPLLTTLATALIGDEGFVWMQGLAAAITVGGVVAVILSGRSGAVDKRGGGAYSSVDPHSNHMLGRTSVGLALAVATAVLWALNSVIVAKVGASGLDAFVLNALRISISIGVTAVMSAAFMGRAKPLLLPIATIKKFWWLFVVEGFCGSMFFAYGLAHSPLVVGATLTALSPVLAVLAALVLRTEKISALKTAGVVLCVFGVWLLVSASRPG